MYIYSIISGWKTSFFVFPFFFLFLKTNLNYLENTMVQTNFGVCCLPWFWQCKYWRHSHWEIRIHILYTFTVKYWWRSTYGLQTIMCCISCHQSDTERKDMSFNYVNEMQSFSCYLLQAMILVTFIY